MACRVAFIPFLVAGDPDLATTATALQKLDALGSDVIELGVPYSVRTRAFWFMLCAHGSPPPPPLSVGRDRAHTQRALPRRHRTMRRALT